jgi:serine/threonine protein phosphatase PrpC
VTPPGQVLRVAAMTHRGAVRRSNQDALVVGSFTACGVDMTDPVSWELPLSSPVLVAVADGMGGHAAGEVASALAVRTLAAAAPQDAEELVAALRRVDAELTELSRSDPAVAGLGTTIAGVLVGPDGGVRFGAGDSRVYLASGGYVVQLSVDDRGPSGGLTQCLGGRGGGSELTVRVEPLDDVGFGRLLLCSDGLGDLVEPESMEGLLHGPGGPVREVKAMWAAAMNASGRDNITIALIAIDPGPWPSGRGHHGEVPATAAAQRPLSSSSSPTGAPPSVSRLAGEGDGVSTGPDTR